MPKVLTGNLILCSCLISTLATGAEPPTLDQAQQAIQRHDSAAAARILDSLIELEPDDPQLYYWRGRERFRLGRFAQSVTDFDRYVELRPDQASRQWERGIACFYAGQFAQGAKQFENYQNFHNADVENTIWRFLCQAKAQSLEVARESMLKTEPDPRPAMDAILELYQGNRAPQEVFALASDERLSGAQRAAATFYANLYVGLYHDLQGRPEEAQKVLEAAASDAALKAGSGRINRYMWDVARLHLNRLKDREKN
ncbi:MAG: tetratricopeptide repeat protein [Pirellulaceae bacterium]